MARIADPPLPPLKSIRLLDQVREHIRYLHYSLSTERAYVQAYVHWIRTYVRHHGLRHPKDIGALGVEAFLTWLAVERNVAAATQNQAKSELLFFYGQAHRHRPSLAPRMCVGAHLPRICCRL